MHAELPPRKPGYAALRQHRWSASGVEYFVTFNLATGSSGLHQPTAKVAIEAEERALEAAGAWHIRTRVIMPDHIHLLFVLGDTFPLAECLRRFKGRLSLVLRTHGLRWQAGFYEHRMRVGKDRLPVFLYILLNPYRAKLLPPNERWPGYFCAKEDWAWFGSLTNESAPVPEWLA